MNTNSMHLDINRLKSPKQLLAKPKPVKAEKGQKRKKPIPFF
jgi:hypothetical protein